MPLIIQSEVFFQIFLTDKKLENLNRTAKPRSEACITKYVRFRIFYLSIVNLKSQTVRKSTFGLLREVPISKQSHVNQY